MRYTYNNNIAQLSSVVVLDALLSSSIASTVREKRTIESIQRSSSIFTRFRLESSFWLPRYTPCTRIYLCRLAVILNSNVVENIFKHKFIVIKLSIRSCIWFFDLLSSIFSDAKLATSASYSIHITRPWRVRKKTLVKNVSYNLRWAARTRPPIRWSARVVSYAVLRFVSYTHIQQYMRDTKIFLSKTNCAISYFYLLFFTHTQKY